MTYRNIALMGKAGSGKDSIAKHLQQRHAFTRVAFADPVREMALEINPIVHTDPYEIGGTIYTEDVRLREVVRKIGWDRAKNEHPEVRRILQQVGQTPRRYSPMFWFDIAVDKIVTASNWNLPVVVTDVRYDNEAQGLRNMGFLLVRVERPGAGLAGDAGAHDSENELNDWPVDVTCSNNGTLADLAWAADQLVERL